MRRPSSFIPLWLTLAACLSSAATSHAALAVSNIDAANHGSALVIGTNWRDPDQTQLGIIEVRWATAFTTGTNSLGYTLDEISVGMAAVWDGGINSLVAKLYTDASDEPGTLIMELNRTGFTEIDTGLQDSQLSMEHYDAAGYTLAPATTYWVELSAAQLDFDQPDHAEWTMARPAGNGGGFIDHSGEGWSITDPALTYTTDEPNWTSNAFVEETGVLSINATAIPEPSMEAFTSLSALVLLACTARRRR